MQRLAILAMVLGASACGDDKDPNTTPDAPRADGGVDAVLTDGPPDDASNGCDYVEQRDLTNDNIVGDGPAEETGVTFTSRSVVCGSLASTHYDEEELIVDVDAYRFTVAAEGDVLVRFAGAAQDIVFVGVDVYGGKDFTDFVGGNTFYGDHGVVALHLAAGDYELSAFALNETAATSDVAYAIEVIADDPATRCAAVTSGGFVEANDQAASINNDVITIPSGAPPALTPSAADAPEATELTLGTQPTRITGTAADVVLTDQYEDKDTYLVLTGVDTNELSIRVDTASTANLDVFISEAGVVPPIFRSTRTTAPETTIVPLKPASAYWITVGARTGSTGLPAAYSASLCGASYELPALP